MARSEYILKRFDYDCTRWVHTDSKQYADKLVIEQGFTCSPAYHHEECCQCDFCMSGGYRFYLD